MTFRRLSMGILLVTGLSLPGIKSAFSHNGGQIPDITSLSDADLKTVTIHMERTACYGTCPAYSVVIHGDGRAEYEGKRHVKEVGMRDGRIELEKIRALMPVFARMKFWNVTEDYSEEKCKGRVCTDMPTVITELSVKGVAHKVKHYYGCASAPKSLFELESAIDKAANSEQWVGDSSKGGPFGTTCFGGN